MKLELLVSPREHFTELVDTGLARLGLKAHPAVQVYLVGLLEFYLDARNLFPKLDSSISPRGEATLAETFLLSSDQEPSARRETLKQMGDRCLYVSGFFSDSLQRKLVDVDYYAQMGGAAYANLAELEPADTRAQVYRIFSRQFQHFADVLAFVSQKSLVQSDESLLRLYDRYLRTGSPLVRDRLEELGVVALPQEVAKKAKQD